jgi:hypothetical protein
MTYLVFRPYWEVPTELMMDELGPRAAWDGEKLAESGIVLVKKDGDQSHNLPLTPENLQRLGRDLRMRQLPGEHNALGRVEVHVPEPARRLPARHAGGGLFALARRDFSHGCIRVGDPVALAEFVLKDQPEWNEESIKAAMDGEDNNRVDLAKPVPVFVTYRPRPRSPTARCASTATSTGWIRSSRRCWRRATRTARRRRARELRGFYGRISTGVPMGTASNSSSMSRRLSATHPSVQSHEDVRPVDHDLPPSGVFMGGAARLTKAAMMRSWLLVRDQFDSRPRSASFGFG